MDNKKKYNSFIDKKSKFVTRQEWLIKNNNGLYIEINNYCKVDYPFKEKVFLYRHKKKTRPKCINDSCNKEVKFKSYTCGYRDYCSTKCSASSKYLQEIKQNTNMKRYGTKSPFQCDDIKEKIKSTNLEKYGVENVFQCDDIKEKIKSTNLEKYGVENPNKLDEFRKKIEKTNIERYGFKTSLLSKDVRVKIKKSLDKNYIIKWAEILKINIKNIEIVNDNIRITNYCAKHNIFTIAKDNLYSRIHSENLDNICTKCYPVSKFNSFGELELIKFIGENINNFDTNNRKLLMGKEIDVLINESNIGVEYNGLYHHSDLFKNDNYHIEKTLLAKDKKINLIHIFEDEWYNKKDIVKSLILSKLNLINKKIYGRKCTIKEISSTESSYFLESNHLQGNVNSLIRIGLFYEDELVSLMTFGRKRKAMGSISDDKSYELYRFCNKLNTTVIGGASKLFSYFTKNYEFDEIISYANRRYSVGDLYYKLGFNFVCETKPNYFYVKNRKRENRFKYRKDILIKNGFNPKMTEKEIMIERGYLRIYDCGSLKFIMKKI